MATVTGAVLESMSDDDLPLPGGLTVADVSTARLAGYLSKVRNSSSDPTDPMATYNETLGRASALALYRQHIARFVDAPAIAAARSNFLNAFGAV